MFNIVQSYSPIKSWLNILSSVSWLGLINPIPWLNLFLVHSLIWFNCYSIILFILTLILFFDSTYFLLLNLTSTIIPLAYPWKVVKEYPNLYYGQYCWLGPDLAIHKQWQYTPILLAVVFVLIPPGESHYRVI